MTEDLINSFHDLVRDNNLVSEQKGQVFCFGYNMFQKFKILVAGDVLLDL